MYNNGKRLGRNRRAVASSIASVIVILMALTVVVFIVYKGFTGGFLMIKEISNKYGPPEINDSTVFLYSIEDLTIANDVDVGCSQVQNVDNSYTCSADKYIDFSVKIKNGGTSMRKINGAIIVCKVECRRGKCQPKDCSNDITERGKDACYIARDESLECDAGSKMFTKGDYIVYPAAICALESSIGCYSPTMSEADKIFNPNQAIYVSAQ